MNNTNQILNQWDQYTLTVDSNQGPLKVNWSNVDNLAWYATLQSGLFGGAGRHISKQLFFEQFQRWATNQWNHMYDIAFYDLKDNATIIDVGSGIAVTDLLTSQYFPNSNFYLIDKVADEFKEGIYFSENYPFYNSWGPVHDAIRSTNIDPSRFTMQDPDADWPESDLIISTFSWCFHYPKSTYWKKAMQSLKKGGKLVLDVRLIDGTDVIKEISEELKFIPYKDRIPNQIPKWIDDYPSPNPDVMGYRCYWVKG